MRLIKPCLVVAVVLVLLGYPDICVANLMAEKSDAAADIFDTLDDSGNGVQVQGLPQVRTEIDGRDSISASKGRALSWEDIPPELMSSVRLYKNSSAKMIEGALGGTVNIQTAKPLDLEAQLLGFTTNWAYYDLAEQASPNFSLLYSSHWQSLFGTLGILLTVSSSERLSRTHGYTLDPFVVRPDLGHLAEGVGQNVYVPHGIRVVESEYFHQRKGASFTLQWVPQNALEIFAKFLASDYAIRIEDHGIFIDDDETTLFPTPGTEFNYSHVGIFTRGYLASSSWRGDIEGTGVRINGQVRSLDRHAITEDIQLGFKWSATVNWAFRSALQYIRSSADTLDLTVYDAAYLNSVLLELAEGKPTLALDPRSENANKKKYFWSAAMDQRDDNSAIQSALTLDASYSLRNNQWLDTILWGVRVTTQQAEDWDTGYNWGTISDNWNMPLQYVDENFPELVSLYQFGDTFDTADRSLRFQLPDVEWIRDYESASQLLANEIKSGLPDGPDDEETGWIPGSFTQADKTDQKQKTMAIYLMALVNKNRTFKWPLTGDIGIRVVSTDTTIRGYGEFDLQENSNLTTADRDFGNGEFFVLNNRKHYVNYLPSANLRFDVRPDLRFRFAASRVISRPEFEKLKPYISISAEVETEADGSAYVKRWYGQSGNPDLKPLIADQVDIAIEWDHNQADSVSSTVLYKNLSNFIVTQASLERYTNEGETRQVQIERPQNADSGYIQGFDLSHKHFFEILPGFSVATTYTYLDSRMENSDAFSSSSMTATARRHLPVEGVSKNNINLVASYYGEKLSFRADYLWRDRYLGKQYDIESQRMTWHTEYGRLNLTLGAKINKNLTVTFDAINLMGETKEEQMGPYVYPDGSSDSNLYLRNWNQKDRRFSLGLRGRF